MRGGDERLAPDASSDVPAYRDVFGDAEDSEDVEGLTSERSDPRRNCGWRRKLRKEEGVQAGRGIIEPVKTSKRTRGGGGPPGDGGPPSDDDDDVGDGFLPITHPGLPRRRFSWSTAATTAWGRRRR